MIYKYIYKQYFLLHFFKSEDWVSIWRYVPRKQAGKKKMQKQKYCIGVRLLIYRKNFTAREWAKLQHRASEKTNTTLC